jgi:hypothetical protein
MTAPINKRSVCENIPPRFPVDWPASVDDSLAASTVAAGLMTRTRLVWWLSPPPDAVTVNVTGPMIAVAGMGIVSVELKSGVPEGTLNTGLVPEGAPDTAKLTSELNPFRP